MNDDLRQDPYTEAGSDPRAARTRSQLLDAGWALLNELRLAEIFGALTVDAIASRAERSERSFWNHFPDWQAYVDALVADIPRLRDLGENENWIPIEVVRELLADSERSILPELSAQAAADNWEAIHLPEELDGLMRQLLLLSRVPTEPGLGEVLLRDYWGMHHSRYTEIYKATGECLGVEPLPPFGWSEYTRLLTALLQGMELVWVCNPVERVPPEVPIAVSTLGLALLRPAGSTETLASRHAALLARSDKALTHPEHTTDLVTACRDAVDRLETQYGTVADAAVDCSWPHNLWEALAATTGQPELQMRDELQRPEMIGALAFAVHLPLDVSRRSSAPANRELTLAVDWLCALARAARKDPWCAHGMLTERLRPGSDRQRLSSIADLGGEFAALLGGPRRSVHDRSVNITLTAALSDNSVSPAEIASATVSRIPGLTENPA